MLTRTRIVKVGDLYEPQFFDSGFFALLIFTHTIFPIAYLAWISYFFEFLFSPNFEPYCPSPWVPVKTSAPYRFDDIEGAIEAVYEFESKQTVIWISGAKKKS